MRKLIALLLAISLFLMGSVPKSAAAETALPVDTTVNDAFVAGLKGFNDPALPRYIEGSIYTSLLDQLDSDSYFVENVSAIYISQEYLDEMAYNSLANIFFGYTLAELEAEFIGANFIFTLGEDGTTIVQPFEDYDDTYDRVLRNVAIGTGVILICVTVSVVSAGMGAPAIAMIFAASAKTGTMFALSGGALGAVSAGIINGIQTNDLDSALKAAALAGSEGFKWGAITGAIAGGASQAMALKGATLNGLTMNEAAAIQKQSGYPLDVIKQFKTMDQYNICKDAGLAPQMINGKAALVRNINMDFIDDFGRTNLQRMEQGLAALDPTTGQAFQLHHIGQKMDSTLAILTEAEHMQSGNNAIWHVFGEASSIDRTAFVVQRGDFWKTLAKTLVTGGV